MTTARAEAGARPRHTIVARALPPQSAGPQTFGKTQLGWLASVTRVRG